MLPPSIDPRDSFLDTLSRVCLALSLGHFVAVPLLVVVLYAGYGVSTNHLAGITTSGLALLLISSLCRFPLLRRKLAFISFAILLAQCAFYSYHYPTLISPVTMFFPLFSALAPPILGRKMGYWVACFSFSFFVFLVYTRRGLNMSEDWALLTLISVALFVPAYLCEMLWGLVLEREVRLKQAYSALEKQQQEQANWLQGLLEASRSISCGQLKTELPAPPSDQLFQDLTQSFMQMKGQLNHYFTELFLRDRLNSLGVLASGVAHELNTPLTSLKFIAQRDRSMSEETRTSLSSEIERMARITKDLLSFARPTGESEVDLSLMLRNLEATLLPLSENRASVEVETPSTPVLVNAIENELQQVVLNLFQNALDAVEGRANPKVKIVVRENGELFVEDNGSGIPQEMLSKVMDPFFTTKAPGKGTGLGLFITQQIARRSGGRLQIESRENTGTTVRIFLPVKLSNKNQAA